jgi:hypothetical protein
MIGQPEELCSLKLITGISLQDSFRVGERIQQNNQMEPAGLGPQNLIKKGKTRSETEIIQCDIKKEGIAYKNFG